MAARNKASELAKHWLLEPDVVFLNHGSFGACPIPVLERQHELRELMEHEPIRFLDREYADRLDAARSALADFVSAEPEGLVFVPNATTGVNAVLRSLRFSQGDELLVTDHEYNACRRALEFVSNRWDDEIEVAHIPFPLDSPEQALEAILGKAGPRTKLALVDHITSPTALVLPIAEIVKELDSRGIDTLVDGAHAPGMVELDVESIGAAYYTGNCHKWLCAPKGAAFLYARRDRREVIHPLTISHGYGMEHDLRSSFRLEFDWVGTDDPSAYFCVPEAIGFMGSLLPGGWPELRKRNHELALAGRDMLCEVLQQSPPCPDSMLGSMASIVLPGNDFVPGYQKVDPLQTVLMEGFGIEVPVMAGPAAGSRLLRISAQAYNTEEQYEMLAKALVQSL